ncbi:hypothetical protein [Paenibacillus sp. NRS-1760]|uniref:hypothetical protein n=1 Tax=Paenibacillus sp. NRS-1760 TaxID=3233902 RepID=UPI003D299CCF
MSTPILLSGAIKRFIEGVLAENVSQQPQVFEFVLPQKTHQNMNAEDYPFVIVRVINGEDQEDQHKVTVNLIFGTKSEQEAGFQDVLNLMERVRVAFRKRRTLDNQFRVELPYKWTLFEDQPYPEWIGQAITTWTLPTISEEVEGI